MLGLQAWPNCLACLPECLACLLGLLFNLMFVILVLLGGGLLDAPSIFISIIGIRMLSEDFSL